MKAIPRTWCLAGCLAAPLAAQYGGTGADGSFHPTAPITLDTTARPDGWDFVDVHVPPGVTVTCIGTNPVVIRSLGTVTIDGSLVADGAPGSADATSVPPGGRGGPGGFDGSGAGGPAGGPAGGQDGWSHPNCGFGPSCRDTGNGGHATPGTIGAMPGTRTYGSARPFDLRGGSGGGSGRYSVGGQVTQYSSGGGGGGVLVLLADGDVTVGATGVIRADGALGAGSGAGGSVMVRTAGRLTVTGSVRAAGVGHPPLATLIRSGDGFVRLDATGSQPGVQGTVKGVSEQLRLPNLGDAGAPRRGATWRLKILPNPGDRVATWISAAPANLPTVFGPLRIDLQAAVFAGMGTAASIAPGRYEPPVTVPVPVPADVALAGATVHAQSLAIGVNGVAWLSNAITRTIQ